MDFLVDPEEMTPEERLEEVAAILAVGCLRWLRLRAEHAGAPDSPPSTEKPLDSSGTPRPLCVEGLTEREVAAEEVSR